MTVYIPNSCMFSIACCDLHKLCLLVPTVSSFNENSGLRFVYRKLFSAKTKSEIRVASGRELSHLFGDNTDVGMCNLPWS